MELNKEEVQLLCDFIGPLNWYETMVILTKTSSKDEAEEKEKRITKLFNKLSRE